MNNLDITLTGQSMIRGDTRVDAPEEVPAIRSLLGGDVVFTNYEAAVYNASKGETTRSGRFASPPESIEALKTFGFNVLALPNNHSFDLKVSGILNTLEAADRAGIAHAGTGRTLSDAAAPCFVESAKGSVAILAVASGLVLDGRATSTQAGCNELRFVGADWDDDDAARIIDGIRTAKQRADLVIVSHHNHHYPGVERPEDFKQLLLSELPARLAPPAWLEDWGRQIVDAGADVVAMHGPPFLHGMEIYKGKPIFYSLGNFIFQVPPESIHLEEPIMWESVVAHLRFRRDGVIDVRLRPIAMNKIGTGLPNPHDQFDVNEYHRTRGLPHAATGAQARYLLERFAELSRRYGTDVQIKDDMAYVGVHELASQTR